jgi:hypothetical protein
VELRKGGIRCHPIKLIMKLSEIKARLRTTTTAAVDIPRAKEHLSLDRPPKNMPNVVNSISSEGNSVGTFIIPSKLSDNASSEEFYLTLNRTKSLGRTEKHSPDDKKRTKSLSVPSTVNFPPVIMSEDVTEEQLAEAENYQGSPAMEFLAALDKNERDLRNLKVGESVSK